MNKILRVFDVACYVALMIGAVYALACAFAGWPTGPRILGAGLFWAFFTAAKSVRQDARFP